MRYLVNDMLLVLPPLQGTRHVIMPGQQTVKDIMREVLTAHKEFSKDYDALPDFFVGKDVLRELFYFCRDQLPYVMESENLQTTRSPTAILTLADNWGVDCKHYAGWIGGVIDACNRAGYTHYTWCYRFASYDPLKTTKEHVFIVVDDDGQEIWIDPAPIENSDGSFTTRSFNDRKVIPFYESDSTPKTSYMSLERIRGINAGCCSMGYVQDAYAVEGGGSDYAGIYRLERYDDGGGGGGYAAEPVNQVSYDPWFADAETVALDPGAPQFYPNDYEKVEVVTRPVITDYPMVTGDPVYMLPTAVVDDIQVTDRVTDTDLTINFDPMTFIRANPWQAALIGAAAVAGIYFLVTAGKKRKRA